MNPSLPGLLAAAGDRTRIWRIGTLYIELGSVPGPGPDVELSCEQFGGGFEVGRDDCIQLETAAATHPLAVPTSTGSCSEPTIDALSRAPFT